MTKKEHETWLKNSKTLLESQVFKDYENAKKAFFASGIYKKYLKSEEPVNYRPGRTYLESGAEEEDLAIEAPDFFRWMNEHYQDLGEELDDDVDYDVNN